MVDHRNWGSEIHGVPRGQLVQWHPLSLPAVLSSCRNLRPTTRAGGAHLYTAPAIQAFQWPPIKGERERYT